MVMRRCKLSGSWKVLLADGARLHGRNRSSPCQVVLLVECVNAAQRKIDLATGGGETAPKPRMPPANNYLEDDGIFTHVPPLDIDVQVGHGL